MLVDYSAGIFFGFADCFRCCSPLSCFSGNWTLLGCFFRSSQVSFADSFELNHSGTRKQNQNIILRNRIIRCYSNVIAIFWYPILSTARPFLFFAPTFLLFIGTFHHFGSSLLLFARTFLHFIGTFYHFGSTFLLFGTTLLFFGPSFLLQVDWFSCR